MTLPFADRQRWDARYAGRPEPEGPNPPTWLIECLRWLPERGRALDIACGEGHVAVALAQRGWEVDAFDISLEALRRARRLAARCGVNVRLFSADAYQYPLPASTYDLVTVFLFLERSTLPLRITHTLRPGGALIYETFTIEAIGWPGFRVSNPEHLLRPNELVELYVPHLRVCRFRDLSLGERPVQSLLAVKPG